MAPAYVNLFRDRLEGKFLTQDLIRPYVWLRHIDDIFMVWTSGKDELGTFFNYWNEWWMYYTIKFMCHLMGLCGLFGALMMSRFRHLKLTIISANVVCEVSRATL